MIEKSIVESFVQKIPQIHNGAKTEYFSKTRDIFEARLQTYISKNQSWLFGAVIGEIGANTFDHNFSFSSDSPRGFFCDFESNPPYVFMCDLERD